MQHRERVLAVFKVKFQQFQTEKKGIMKMHQHKIHTSALTWSSTCIIVSCYVVQYHMELNFNWSKLHQVQKRKCISLPTKQVNATKSRHSKWVKLTLWSHWNLISTISSIPFSKVKDSWTPHAFESLILMPVQENTTRYPKQNLSRKKT